MPPPLLSLLLLFLPPHVHALVLPLVQVYQLLPTHEALLKFIIAKSLRDVKQEEHEFPLWQHGFEGTL
jgi:hypothetical protein